jgi:flagellar basal-body rod protein FlgG
MADSNRPREAQPMIRSLWISKTGMEGQQTKLDAVTNNLANVSTNGFKRAGVVFEDLMYQNMRQAGAASSEQSQLPTGLQLGLGVRAAATTRNFSQGTLQQTGNNLDVAIKGNGMFQIQLPDGSTAYTRDGSFQVDANGQLVTNAGYTVQPGITIPQAATSVTIAADGTVNITLQGQAQPQQVGQLQLASFVNPAGLDPLGQNLYAETGASGTPNAGAPGSDGLGSLQQGFVEGSNVNVVEELVTMIATQRAYELNSKAIQTSDQMLQRLGQL